MNSRQKRSIGQRVAASLAAVSMLLVAAPASAAVYFARFTGEVGPGSGANMTRDNTNYFGLGTNLPDSNSNLVGSSFVAQFRYDTSLGLATTNDFVDMRVGGPLAQCPGCLFASPILSAFITINGKTDSFDVNGAGWANVITNESQWRQTFFAVGFYEFIPPDFYGRNALQLFVLNTPGDPGQSPRLGAEYTGADVGNLGAPDTEGYASGFETGGKNYYLALNTGPGSVTLGSIPEPTTWSLMIIGFGGAGAMLRNRRRVLVRA